MRERALLVDLYQLTMMQVYLERGLTSDAVFELFVRDLPPRRKFLIAAGLAQAVDYLTHLRFDERELDWLNDSGRFSRGFVDHLATLRFDGDVHAVPEGTACFAEEPILRVTASLPLAQLVESRVLNLIHFQTLVASKAARCVLAAPGKQLVEFGLRRAHGAEAALLAARACYLAGFSGTSNVLASAWFGVPAFGTMAHSYVQAHDEEAVAFESFARSHPRNVVLLLDTYDTEAAARRVSRLAFTLAREGIDVAGVRLDSGDLTQHARTVRRILDDAGQREIEIFASGDLDEDRLASLVATSIPIDGFGVGTRVVTSRDAPSLDMVYKLSAYAGRPRAKRSEGKATLPGVKQVYRARFSSGRMRFDELALDGEQVTDATPLIEPVMRRNEPPRPLPTLEQARRHAAAQLEALPATLRLLHGAPEYAVRRSRALSDLAEEFARRR